MADVNKHTMLEAYMQLAQVMMFFSGFFRSPAMNFYSTEKVEIDIVRSEEDVAIVVQDMATGYRENKLELLTNKEFTPPVFKESVPLNSFDLFKRNPGENPFANIDFRANLITRMFMAYPKIEQKIRRAIELQASQILQTGTVSLKDENGVTLYTLNFLPKATHFPTASVIWSGAANRYEDVRSLLDVIRADGLVDCDELHFGATAWEWWLQDATVKERMDNRRMSLGEIAPEQRGKGGTFMGFIWIGNYKVAMYTYNARYKDPQTGVSTPYMHPGKVIARYSGSRMDATFGAIPNIGQLLGAPNQINLPELPTRLNSSDISIDLHPIAYISQDGNTLHAGIGARPLLIPTAIDQYGCLDTQLT